MPATIPPATFAHSMPWGAEFQPGGGVRFRLWAPGHSSLSLVLEDRTLTLPMARNDDGWHELTTDEARAGTRYRFALEDEVMVPDPASRYQPDDVFGPSVVMDPRAYKWQTPDWKGRPWEEAIWYELHVGTFSPEGTFDGIRRKLDHLVDLGVSVVELMPIAEFPGARNWGYDGVQLYAPEAGYGPPDELKRLIDEAHQRDLMVFLDVVYNHFGPEGNYLGVYAPDFFNQYVHTPWGGAIDFRKRAVRDYAMHNVLYWLQEFRLDGLRFDAVDHISDLGEEHLLEEIARTARAAIEPDRHVHLVVENGENSAHLLQRDRDGKSVFYNAQWNDDIHHCFHVLMSGDTAGYYSAYSEHTVERFAKALSTGFVYQDDPYPWRDGKMRGEKSGHLPPTAFVSFIQNHDQIGNRAFGERMSVLSSPEAMRAMYAVLLLAPQVPLLFQGEEWGARQPFCFFTDFHDELADAVREGRRREFAKFPQFSEPEDREHIPDPNALSTFEASRIDWSVRDADPSFFDYVKALIRIRREIVIPRLKGIGPHSGESTTIGHAGLRVTWRMGDGSRLTLLANLDDRPYEKLPPPEGELIFESTPGVSQADVMQGRLPPWTTLWYLQQTQ